LQLCDSGGNDLSSSGLTVHAVSVTQVSTSISGTIEDSGNANPDNDFRFDSTLGITGCYIFNLKTTGLSTGTYSVNFTVTGDSLVYAADFQIKYRCRAGLRCPRTGGAAGRPKALSQLTSPAGRNRDSAVKSSPLGRITRKPDLWLPSRHAE